ncbi:hypothetical protein FDENT_2312 [Fusarium denticulatum]|uniref:Uncharacterized protein n=1 Tax=Fusarium denticulatum TaxID=48507 RepID=A0A8H6CV18_9HYPO|nr:hypothetical protein FDENT_2312 [Fusarium denticulatum]
MSTRRCFLRLPSGLRLHIYYDYFQLDGGYVYDTKSDKLKTSDDQPIDLALILTCRTIADETRHLPLSLNAVTFSTLYREDWQSLAGCFNVATTYYRHLEADLVLHLAEFITPEMYGLFALKYPDVANQLEALSRDHRLRYLDDNINNLSQVMAIESASGAKRARIDELVNRTSGVLSADFNMGVALDAQALARQTEHLHGSNWVSRWRLRLRDGSLSLAEEMPPEQNYDRLDDIFEFQTDDGNAVINLRST